MNEFEKQCIEELKKIRSGVQSLESYLVIVVMLLGIALGLHGCK